MGEMSKPVVRAAGFIIFRRMPDIQFLLMQTSYGNFHWTPPKGHVDPGETDYEAALRETKEEAGLDQSSFTVISNFCCEVKYNKLYDGNIRPKVVTYWCAELIEYNCPVIMSDEHQAFNWLPLQQ